MRAIVQGRHGNRPKRSVRHEDESGDAAGCQVGFHGPDQPFIELLGVQKIGVAGPPFEGEPERAYFFGQAAAGNRHDELLQPRGQTHEQLKAIRQNDGIDDGRGVGFLGDLRAS